MLERCERSGYLEQKIRLRASVVKCMRMILLFLEHGQHKTTERDREKVGLKYMSTFEIAEFINE